MARKLFSALLILLIISSPAFAARPLTTDDAGIVDPGKFEIETGYASAYPRGGESDGTLIIQIKTGVIDNFDFAVESTYSVCQINSFGDAILHGKYKLFGDDNCATSARLDVKLATGDINTGLGSGYTDYVAFLINSTKVGKAYIHTNLTHSIIGVPTGSPNLDFSSFSIALEAPVVEDKLTLVAELLTDNTTTPYPATINLGGFMYINGSSRVDIGAAIGLNETADEKSITAGYTIEI